MAPHSFALLRLAAPETVPRIRVADLCVALNLPHIRIGRDPQEALREVATRLERDSLGAIGEPGAELATRVLGNEIARGRRGGWAEKGADQRCRD